MTGSEQQRKLVTVLFADVSGFTAMSETMDAEDVTEVMNSLWQRLDGAITAHGGRIDKHIGDAVMAIWGTEAAREDDAERAIRAALDMQVELQRFAESRPTGTPLRMRIGINSGPALLGEVGTTAEFTAIGDTVNTASRLEHAAPVGGILISQATYQHVRSLFEMVEQKPLTVKGKTEPLKVYTVERARPRAFQLETRGIEGVRTPMIGRKIELELLQDTFYTVAQSKVRRVFTVSGEAGLGKSRLLHEFDAWLRALPKQVTYFRGRAGQEMQLRPYALLRDVFVARFQIQESDARQVANRKLEQGLLLAFGSGDEAQMRAHLIGQLLGFDFSDSQYLVDTIEDGKQLQKRGLASLGEYFKAITEKDPAVILLEDLHWADDSSLDAVDHLMAGLGDQPLLLVCLARPALYERRPAWGRDQAFHFRVELRPLSDDESRQLVGEILSKVEEIPPVLIDLVVENAQGNPFYAEELIRMLIEDGAIITSSNQWLVNPARLTEVRVPATLTGVLQARLDGLNAAERAVLQRAAVVGRAFWNEVLNFLAEGNATEGTAGEMSAADTESALQALQQRALIVREESAAFEGVQEYAFNNVVLREVTYDSVLKRERRAYHARVAQWLIDHGGERVQEYAGLIAEHLERAQKMSDAVVYLRVAGEQAQRVSAFREALNFFKRALSLLAASDREERLILTRQVGRALYDLGHWDAAREQLQESLAMAKAMANPREIAASLRGLGIVAESQGKYEEAKERLQESLANARSAADPRQMMASLQALGNLAEKQGHYAEAKERLEEGLHVVRQYGDQIGAAQAAYFHSTMDKMSGAVDAAKTRVVDKLDRFKLGVDERRERLSKPLGKLGRFGRKKTGEEETGETPADEG